MLMTGFKNLNFQPRFLLNSSTCISNDLLLYAPQASLKTSMFPSTDSSNLFLLPFDPFQLIENNHISSHPGHKSYFSTSPLLLTSPFPNYVQGPLVISFSIQKLFSDFFFHSILTVHVASSISMSCITLFSNYLLQSLSLVFLSLITPVSCNLWLFTAFVIKFKLLDMANKDFHDLALPNSSSPTPYHFPPRISHFSHRTFSITPIGDASSLSF